MLNSKQSLGVVTIDDFVQAARLNDIEIVEEIINTSQVFVDGYGKDQRTALMQACAWGAKNSVQLLLRRQANPNLADPDGTTALHLAAENGSDKIIKLLVHHGADVDAVDEDGYSPLHVASAEGFIKCVKELLLAGASLELKTFIDKKSPLQLAMEEHYHEIAFLLRGWDPQWSSQIKGKPTDDTQEPPPTLLQHISPTLWDTEGVGIFLQKLKLGSYVPIFKECSINGPALLEINEEKLDNEIGMTNTRHRAKLLKAVADLNLQYICHPPTVDPEGSQDKDEAIKIN